MKEQMIYLTCLVNSLYIRVDLLVVICVSIVHAALVPQLRGMGQIGGCIFFTFTCGDMTNTSII